MTNKVSVIIIEVLIYGAWFWVLRKNIKRGGASAKTENAILLTALVTTAVMEILNERIAKYAYYPYPIIAMPGFDFPIAILLGGGLFTWFAYVASGRIIDATMKEKNWTRYAGRLVAFLIMVCAAWPLEPIFLTLGFFKYRQPIGYNLTHMIGVYVYYLMFTVPAIAVARLITRAKSPKPSPAAPETKEEKEKRDKTWYMDKYGGYGGQ